MNNYLSKVATALSQFVNAVILNGDPDESISGRAYRRGTIGGSKKWKAIMRVIDALFFFDPDHCCNSFYFDLNKARLFVEQSEGL